MSPTKSNDSLARRTGRSLLALLRRAVLGEPAEPSAGSLSAEQAIAVAKRSAEQLGWAWREPARAQWFPERYGKPERWEIYSNAQARGAMARFVIDAKSGEVLDKGYIPY
jgi:hypothetical protein